MDQVSGPSDGDGPTPALLLRLGDENLAVPLGDVREVVVSPVVSSLPTAPAALLGLFSVRGEIVPLYDPASLIGFGSTPDPSYAVIIDLDGAPAALAFGSVPELVELGEQIADAESEGTLGVRQAGAVHAVVVDVAALFTSVGVTGRALR